MLPANVSPRGTRPRLAQALLTSLLKPPSGGPWPYNGAGGESVSETPGVGRPQTALSLAEGRPPLTAAWRQAAIFFTSRSTGLPKMAEHSHASLGIKAKMDTG